MPLITLPLSFTIDTERCRLRVPAEQDIPHIFEATRYAGFNDGMLWEPPNSPDELYKPLAESLQAWAVAESFVFTITARESGQFLGRIGIRSSKTADVWNIGFFLHPQQQGRGYMREAAAAVVAFGFEVLQANRVEATHATWNLPSERVLLAIGMTFREHVPEGFKKKGEWVAENRLAIDREAWHAVPRTVGK